ncbi:hypothetical protein HZA41_02355 [Candidatus Peregrinibacteria bacterium]|nr:hypothetical protein [Candidatus Peregrinibacteria bacterium]
MDDRKQKIFLAIVQHFIHTATPVGSNTILLSYRFEVSPATIRNEMASLEHEGLIYQPHTSAGRIPTNLGYRLYVNKLMDTEKIRKKVIRDIQTLREKYAIRKIKEKIYDAVALLAETVENVSFATFPDQSRTFYLGLSRMMKQPEFREDPLKASQVVEVFEKDNRFLNILNELDITDQSKIFIGEENIIEQIKSCSLVVTKYTLEEGSGFIGIMGPTRMDYPYATAAVTEIKHLLGTSE